MLSQLVTAWQLDRAAGAWLTIAVQIGFVSGAVLSALLTLADRIGPRRLIFIGTLIASAATGLLIMAAGLGIALPLRFATGFGLAFVYPPFVKLVASWFRAGRGTAMGTMLGALTLGTAAPHIVRGLGAADWRIVCIATSLMCLAGGLVAEFVLHDGPFPFPRAPFDPRRITIVLRHRATRLVALAYLGHMWELYAMWNWFPAFARERLAAQGYSTAVASLYAGAAIGCGAFGC